MNNAEFVDFIDYHNKRFVGILKFLTTNECTEAWQAAFKTVSLDHAKVVSQNMFEGKIEPPEFAGFGSHPRIIIAATEKLAARERLLDIPYPGHDPTDTFKCKSCWDNGFLRVYHWRYYHEILDGTTPSRQVTLETLPVACPHCEYGKWLQMHKRQPEWHGAMFEAHTMDDEEFDAFVEFVLAMRSQMLTPKLIKFEQTNFT